jgi:hypothetical protein
MKQLGLAILLCGAYAHAGPVEQGVIEPPTPARVYLAGGLTSGIADGLGVVPTARAELRLPYGLEAAVLGGSRAGMDFRETSTAVAAGYRFGLVRGRLTLAGGLELGAGLVAQTPMLGSALYSGTGFAAPTAAVSLRISADLAIGLETSVAAEIVKRDRALTVVMLPAAWLGLVVDLPGAGS